MARTSKTSTAKKATTRRATAAPKKTSTAAKTVAAEEITTTTVPTTATTRTQVLSKKNLNPSRLLAELVGTFILTLVVVAALSGKFTLSLFTTPDVMAQAAQTGQSIPGFALVPWVTGFAFAALVLITYRVSGGHLNPAITAGMMALRRMSPIEGVGYILAQVLGAMLALSIASRLISVMDPQTGQMGLLDPATLFSHMATWNVFTAELLGAAIFGFGVAAAMRLTPRVRAGLLGGSLILGSGVAMMAGAGMLNPALAVGTGLIGFGENVWPLVGIYLGGTTLGVIIGMALYSLLDRQPAVELQNADL